VKGCGCGLVTNFCFGAICERQKRLGKLKVQIELYVQGKEGMS
jgi:hypothetical protein